MPNEARTVRYPGLTPASMVEARGNLLCCEVERELIILDAATGTYFGLNPVGSRIWVLIQKPTTLAATCETLVSEFDIDTAECETELYRFIGELESRGLVEVWN